MWSQSNGNWPDGYGGDRAFVRRITKFMKFPIFDEFKPVDDA